MNEAYTWVLRIIDSCNNPFHVECAKAVIECFKKKYGEVEALDLEIRLNDLDRIINYK